MGRDRFGMTWVEWLVLVTLGGIALSLLLLPVFNTSLRPGRTNLCKVQLKNLALAAIMYENSQGRFPGWAMDFGTYDVSKTPGNPSGPDADNPQLRRHRKIGTWAVALLPYLETQPTYEYWTMDRYPIVGGGNVGAPASTGASGEGFSCDAAPNLAIMQCPSSPTLRGDMGRNSYIANTGLHFPTDTELGGSYGFGAASVFIEPQWRYRESPSAVPARADVTAPPVRRQTGSGQLLLGRIRPIGVRELRQPRCGHPESSEASSRNGELVAWARQAQAPARSPRTLMDAAADVWLRGGGGKR